MLLNKISLPIESVRNPVSNSDHLLISIRQWKFSIVVTALFGDIFLLHPLAPKKLPPLFSTGTTLHQLLFGGHIACNLKVMQEFLNSGLLLLQRLFLCQNLSLFGIQCTELFIKTVDRLQQRKRQMKYFFQWAVPETKTMKCSKAFTLSLVALLFQNHDFPVEIPGPFGREQCSGQFAWVSNGLELLTVMNSSLQRFFRLLHLLPCVAAILQNGFIPGTKRHHRFSLGKTGAQGFNLTER